MKFRQTLLAFIFLISCINVIAQERQDRIVDSPIDDEKWTIINTRPLLPIKRYCAIGAERQIFKMISAKVEYRRGTDNSYNRNYRANGFKLGPSLYLKSLKSKEFSPQGIFFHPYFSMQSYTEGTNDLVYMHNDNPIAAAFLGFNTYNFIRTEEDGKKREAGIDIGYQRILNYNVTTSLSVGIGGQRHNYKRFTYNDSNDGRLAEVRIARNTELVHNVEFTMGISF